MISIEHLTKVYPGTGAHALNDVSITVPDGDVYGIIGISGAGKSTLVRCVNLLERPTSGRIVVDGQDVTELEGAALRKYRQRVSMVFQNFGLLAQKTALANVCFPFLAAHGKVTAENKDRARELLDMVGLADRADSYPAQLSGGQKQRVAIARALATSPEYLLCDEATSALDPASTESVLDVLKRVNEDTGVTLLVITHSMDVVKTICKDVAVLAEGELQEQGPVERIFVDPQADVTKALLGRASWND
ncbi:MAG: methionine ABC transporter ATP-binding protein [Coriobacteriales bacterium]|nr:methionine ABC transporter ATP-binding protein [Coriobacteriales bacterium]